MWERESVCVSEWIGTKSEKTTTTKIDNLKVDRKASSYYFATTNNETLFAQTNSIDSALFLSLSYYILLYLILSLQQHSFFFDFASAWKYAWIWKGEKIHKQLQNTWIVDGKENERVNVVEKINGN